MSEQSQRAHWDKLSDEQKEVLKGHVGPGWLPQWFCNEMAFYFKKLYKITVQERHDCSYIVGGNANFRSFCDSTLLERMREDSATFEGEQKRLAYFVSDLIYIVVRLFGWLSFQWRERSLTQEELSVELEKKKQALEEGESKLKWVMLVITAVPLIIFTLSSYLIFKLLPYFTSWRIDQNRKATPSQTTPIEEP